MDTVKTTFNNITSSTFGIVIVSCIIIFIVVRVIVYLMQYSLTTGLSNAVQLIPGKLPGSQKYTIQQDAAGHNIVGLSDNQQHGIEFTYSVWLKIDSAALTNTSDEYDISQCDWAEGVSCDKKLIHIFNKGDNTGDDTLFTDGDHIPGGIKRTNNAPGLYLANNGPQVSLLVFMDTIDQPSYERKPIIVSNVPIMKWISLLIIAKSNVLYIYVNGQLKSSRVFTDEVFKQNYDPIHLNDGGISWGSLADLSYYSRSLNGLEIQKLVLSGPNQNKIIDTNSIFNETPAYLSSKWYDN